MRLKFMGRSATAITLIALFAGPYSTAVAAPEKTAPPPNTPTVEAPEQTSPESPPPPQISLIIIGPGEDIHSLYGHAVLAVRQPGETQERAQTYNFGVTDFEGSLKRFVMGRAEFRGTVAPYGELLADWRGQDRDVVRYPLNLSPKAARRLAARAQHDVRPEHTHYVYDPFRANCAIKLRDLIDTYAGGAVYGALGNAPIGRSFRDDVRAAYANHPSLLFLSEVLPGVSLDTARTQWELGYLPAHLERGLLAVNLEDGLSLLGAPVVDHSRVGPDPRDGWPHTAQTLLALFALLLGLLAFYAPRLGARARGYILSALVLAYSVLGVLLLVLHATTDWPDMRVNWLLAVVLPLDAFLFWPALRLALRAQAPGRKTRRYLIFRMGLTGLVVILTPLVLAGPWAPKWVAMAGLIAAWRLLGESEKKAETSPERLYTKRTGEYPALSRARKRRTMWL